MATRRGVGRNARAIPARIDSTLERVDVDGVVAGELGHRAPGARDDRAAAGERLGDRDPEALVERGVDEAAGAAVERGELVVADLAEPGDVRRRLDVPPAAGTDDPELALDGGGDPGEVLPRLERADREHVVALAPAAPPA